jgi:hypothetical protein
MSNYGLFEIIKYRLSWLCPLIKCAYQEFIIQNLDVVTFELGMKVCDLWNLWACYS